MKKLFLSIHVLFFFILFLLSSCAQVDPDIEVTAKQPRVPVLKLKAENPVLIIKVQNKSVLKTINSIKISLAGTDDLTDIDSVKVFYLASDSIPRTDRPAALFGKPMSPTEEMVIEGDRPLDSFPSFFMVSFQLTNNADLHHKINVSCLEIKYNDNTYSIPVDLTPDVKQRIGVAVRKHQDDNVHTYRIPGLTTTNKGTLLGVYDVRRESSRDLQGHIDIGVSRSTDGGNTWEPMRIGLDMGAWGGLPEKFNGVSDACILVDENSEDIFLAGLWMYGVIDDRGEWVEGLTEESDAWNHQWRNKGSQPGFGVKQTSQFIIAKSTDDGKTWSEPVNLTQLCKKEEWWLWAPAPGHGITMDDGTLLFPTQGRDENGESFSNITYSKDGGETWTTSAPAYGNTTENMAVQLSDGRIMLNMRYNLNRNNQSDTNGRVVATTNDLGNTWVEHPTSRSALIESTCMASIHKHYYTENGEEKSLLLFSNPNTKTGRHHMTVKISLDDGETWPEEYWLLLDEGRSRGYSCLTSIDEQNIGILYEGSQADMTFESIPLKEILNPDLR